MKLNVWINLALPALLSAPLMAGVVYEIEITDHDQSPPGSSTSEMVVEGRNMKMGIASPTGDRKDGDAIWRGDRREMIIVDHDDRSYTVMDEAAISSIAGQVSGVEAQMAEALKNVPPEQRAMVEKMMKERMPQQAPSMPVIEFRSTSESAEMHGYPCVKYIVVSNGRELRRMWVTDWDNVEGGEEAAEVFHEMGSFFSEMIESLSKASGGMFGGGFGDGAMEQWSELDGFPVATEDLAGDGSIESKSVLRSVHRRDFDPAAFEPPAGYKRRSMGPQ